jgi:hypothetical protein
MSPYRHIDTRPPPRALKELAIVFFLGASAVALWFWIRRDQPGVALGLAGAGVLLAGLSLVPAAGRVVYVIWMGIGVTLGLVTSPILLAMVYFGLFWPMAVVLRWCKRDPLRLSKQAKRDSYWEPCEKPPRESFFHQY